MRAPASAPPVGRARVLVHNAYMPGDAAITIRLPAELKRRLEARAAENRRSVSAQAVCDLESALARDDRSAVGGGRFLGRFAGARLPTDEELREVRAMMWSRIELDG